MDTFALLDKGSTTTLIATSLTDEIGASGEASTLTMRWTNSTERSYSSQRVTVGLSERGQENFEVKARTMDKLNLPVQFILRKKLATTWCHLDDKEVLAFSEARPRILNGQDNGHFVVARTHGGGGAWERLVRSVKVALAVSLRERSPKTEVLSTLFVEAKNTINCRPLTGTCLDQLPRCRKPYAESLSDW